MTRSDRLNEMAQKMYALADDVERQAAELRLEGEAERARQMRTRTSDIKVEAVIAEGMTEPIGMVAEIRDVLVLGSRPCSVCDGAGSLPFHVLGEPKPLMRDCPVCRGGGRR